VTEDVEWLSINKAPNSQCPDDSSPINPPAIIESLAAAHPPTVYITCLRAQSYADFEEDSTTLTEVHVKLNDHEQDDQFA
jgi:hypothetical protein